MRFIDSRKLTSAKSLAISWFFWERGEAVG
jgi:hypothetical protein